MELLRFSAFWCGAILFGSIVLEEAGESFQLFSTSFFFFFFKFATEKIRWGSFTRRAVKLFLEHKLYFSPKNDVAFNLKNTRKCPTAHVIQPHSSHEPSSTRAPLLPILPFFFPLETSINRCLRSHRRASPARTPLLFKMAYLPSLMWTLRKTGGFLPSSSLAGTKWFWLLLIPPSQNPPPSLLSAIIWSPGWQLLPFIPFHGPPPGFKWHALFRGVALMI